MNYKVFESSEGNVWKYVFTEEDIVKGFIQIKDKEIKKLYVDSFFQGEGIGSRLINYAIDNFGVNHLWALEKNEKAICFYKKQEYRTTSSDTLG